MRQLGDNVFYDEASDYAWEELNETSFLERVISEGRTAMGSDFDDHEFYVLSSHDPDVRPESLDHPSARKVLIFISDESAALPTALQPHYHAIFKAYLPHELPGTNVFPFPLGYVRDVTVCPVKPIDQRGISIFFSGNLGHHRLPLYRALHPAYKRLPASATTAAFALSSRPAGRRLIARDLSDTCPGAVLKFSSGFKQGLAAASYGEHLAESRIVLCPRGPHSVETFRHMEAMRAGAIVVSEPLPDTHFYRRAPIVTVEDWMTGLDEVRRLLQDMRELERLQGATTDWWRDVCSERATALYVRDRLADLARGQLQERLPR